MDVRADADRGRRVPAPRGASSRASPRASDPPIHAHQITASTRTNPDRRSFRWSRPFLLAGAAAATLASFAPSPALAQTPISLTPPASINGMGSGVSPVIDATYMGVGIEPSNLLAFTGPDQPNPLTNQLLSNIAGYMGAPPHIRVGGNSGDNMLYDASNQSLGIENNPSAKGQGKQGSQTDSWVYGPAYYKAMDNFPKGTPITFGLNLAYNAQDSISRVVDQASSAFASLKQVTLNSLEIGNEPDLYQVNQYRPASWTADDWGNEWVAKASAVYEQVIKPRKLRQDMFEAASTATTATKNGHPYRIANLMSTAVASSNGQYLKGWSQHDYYFYVGVSNSKLTVDQLLDLPATAKQFSEWQSQAGEANSTGKPYYIREMGSVGPTGIKGISDTFANSLWTLNFFLFASTVGVSSVQMHMTDNSYAAPWQPNDQGSIGPHVRSSYYAFAAMGQIIGTGCNTNIASVDLNNVPDNYSNRLVAYAVYRQNTLQSIVLINANPVGSDVTTAPPQRRGHGHGTVAKRQDTPSVTFSISLPKLNGKKFYLSALTAESSTATQNTTWNGLDFESSGTGKPNQVNQTDASQKQQTATVGSDGTLTVTVPDSSAMVANLNVVLGGDDGSKSLCSANGSSPQNQPTGSNPGFTGKPSSNKLSKTTIIIIAAAGGGGAALAAILAAAIGIACIRKKRRAKTAALAAGGRITWHDSTKPDSSTTAFGLGKPYGNNRSASSREFLVKDDEYAMADRSLGRAPSAHTLHPNADTAAAGFGYGYTMSHGKKVSSNTISTMGDQAATDPQSKLADPAGYMYGHDFGERHARNISTGTFTDEAHNAPLKSAGFGGPDPRGMAAQGYAYAPYDPVYSAYHSRVAQQPGYRMAAGPNTYAHPGYSGSNVRTDPAQAPYDPWVAAQQRGVHSRQGPAGQAMEHYPTPNQGQWTGSGSSSSNQGGSRALLHPPADAQRAPRGSEAASEGTGGIGTLAMGGNSTSSSLTAATVETAPPLRRGRPREVELSDVRADWQANAYADQQVPYIDGVPFPPTRPRSMSQPRLAGQARLAAGTTPASSAVGRGQVQGPRPLPAGSGYRAQGSERPRANSASRGTDRTGHGGENAANTLAEHQAYQAWYAQHYGDQNIAAASSAWPTAWPSPHAGTAGSNNGYAHDGGLAAQGGNLYYHQQRAPQGPQPALPVTSTTHGYNYAPPAQQWPQSGYAYPTPAAAQAPPHSASRETVRQARADAQARLGGW